MTRWRGAGGVGAAAMFLLWACVADEPATTAGVGDDAGGGDASNDAGGDGATDGGAKDGASGDGACSGSACGAGAVHVSTWCSDFRNATTGTADSVCAVLASGDVYCWGSNINGELGNGDKTNRSTATKVATDSNGAPFAAVEVSVGVGHTCARKSDGSIWCWGGNSFGESGSAPSTPILRPTRVGSGVGYKHVYARGFYSCAVDGTDQVVCWGSNDQDALGNTGSASATPATITFNAGTLKSDHVALGDEGACALVGDNAYCWGTDRHLLLGQLGSGAASASPVHIGDPSGVAFLNGAAEVAYGRFTAFALLTSGMAVGWGDDDFGALGTPGTADFLNPKYFGDPGDGGPGVGSIAQLSAGLMHTCARKMDGSIVCAGGSGLFQFVNPSTLPATCTETSSSEKFGPTGVHCTPTPTPLLSAAASPITGATDVAAGCGVTCFVGSDTNVYCSGNDAVGATGHASGADEVACTWAPFVSGSLPCTAAPTLVQGFP